MLPTDVQSFYLTQGVLGATVIVLLIALAYIYVSKNKELTAEREKRTAENATWQAKFEAIAEARRIEAKSDTKDMIEIVRSNSQNMELMASKIEVGKNLERRAQ